MFVQHEAPPSLIGWERRWIFKAGKHVPVHEASGPFPWPENGKLRQMGGEWVVPGTCMGERPSNYGGGKLRMEWIALDGWGVSGHSDKKRREQLERSWRVVPLAWTAMMVAVMRRRCTTLQVFWMSHCLILSQIGRVLLMSIMHSLQAIVLAWPLPDAAPVMRLGFQSPTCSV